MSALALAVALAVSMAQPAMVASHARMAQDASAASGSSKGPTVPAGCYRRPLEQGSGSVLVCKGGVL